MSRTLALLAVAGLLYPSLARADLAWRERTNDLRQEGLRDQLVSGRNYELLGVQLVPSATKCAEGIAESAEREELHFTIPGNEPLGLRGEVRELPSNYMMRPASIPRSGFRWRVSEVIEPAGIDVQRLTALANPEGRRLYYPVYLGFSESVASNPAYRFTFEIGGTWKLDWSIQDADSKAVVAQGKATGNRGLAHLCWDGQRADGMPGVGDIHVLRAVLKLRTSRASKHNIHVRFVANADHKP